MIMIMMMMMMVIIIIIISKIIFVNGSVLVYFNSQKLAGHATLKIRMWKYSFCMYVCIRLVPSFYLFECYLRAMKDWGEMMSLKRLRGMLGRTQKNFGLLLM